MNRICAVFCDSMGNVVKFNHLAEVLPARREIVSGPRIASFAATLPGLPKIV